MSLSPSHAATLRGAPSWHALDRASCTSRPVEPEPRQMRRRSRPREVSAGPPVMRLRSLPSPSAARSNAPLAVIFFTDQPAAAEPVRSFGHHHRNCLVIMLDVWAAQQFGGVEAPLAELCPRSRPSRWRDTPGAALRRGEIHRRESAPSRSPIRPRNHRPFGATRDAHRRRAPCPLFSVDRRSDRPVADDLELVDRICVAGVRISWLPFASANTAANVARPASA